MLRAAERDSLDFFFYLDRSRLLAPHPVVYGRFQFDDQKNSASLIFVEIKNFSEHLYLILLLFSVRSRGKGSCMLRNKNDTIISSQTNLS